MTLLVYCKKCQHITLTTAYRNDHDPNDTYDHTIIYVTRYRWGVPGFVTSFFYNFKIKEKLKFFVTRYNNYGIDPMYATTKTLYSNRNTLSFFIRLFCTTCCLSLVVSFYRFVCFFYRLDRD